MQRQMEEQQKALEEKEFTATVGGGAVEVVVTGKRVLKSLKLDPDAVDPEDVETLEDMILSAVNQAMAQVDEAQGASMSGLTGGFGGLGL